MSMRFGLVLTRVCDLREIEGDLDEHIVEEIHENPSWLFDGVEHGERFTVSYPGDNYDFVLCNDITELEVGTEEDMTEFTRLVTKSLGGLKASEIAEFKKALRNIEKHYGIELNWNKIGFRKELKEFVR